MEEDTMQENASFYLGNSSFAYLPFTIGAMTSLSKNYCIDEFDGNFTKLDGTNSSVENSSWWPEFNLTGNRGGAALNQVTPEEGLTIGTDDAAWIPTATFIIFTMQSGEFKMQHFLLFHS